MERVTVKGPSVMEMNVLPGSVFEALELSADIGSAAKIVHKVASSLLEGERIAVKRSVKGIYVFSKGDAYESLIGKISDLLELHEFIGVFLSEDQTREAFAQIADYSRPVVLRSESSSQK